MWRRLPLYGHGARKKLMKSRDGGCVSSKGAITVDTFREDGEEEGEEKKDFISRPSILAYGVQESWATNMSYSPAELFPSRSPLVSPVT